MEQAQYQQIVASLEGLTEAQINALLQALRERQDADGVQRLIMGPPGPRKMLPALPEHQQLGLAPSAGTLQRPAHARTIHVSCVADFLSVKAYTV